MFGFILKINKMFTWLCCESKVKCETGAVVSTTGASGAVAETAVTGAGTAGAGTAGARTTGAGTAGGTAGAVTGTAGAGTAGAGAAGTAGAATGTVGAVTGTAVRGTAVRGTAVVGAAVTGTAGAGTAAMGAVAVAKAVAPPTYGTNLLTPVKVVSVYDGDTCTIIKPEARIFDAKTCTLVTTKVRLYGYDAPEVKGDTRIQGIAVRDVLKEVVQDKIFVLVTGKSVDMYGRLLGNLYTVKNEELVCVNELMMQDPRCAPYAGKTKNVIEYAKPLTDPDVQTCENLISQFRLVLDTR